MGYSLLEAAKIRPLNEVRITLTDDVPRSIPSSAKSLMSSILCCGGWPTERDGTYYGVIEGDLRQAWSTGVAANSQRHIRNCRQLSAGRFAGVKSPSILHTECTVPPDVHDMLTQDARNRISKYKEKRQ